MIDVKDLVMVQPPVIADLTDTQKAAVQDAYRAVENNADAVEDMLTNAGLGSVHAPSATAQALMNAMVRLCFVTAILDGRKPNREWFLHNCATHFDKWAAAQCDDDTKEPNSI